MKYLMATILSLFALTACQKPQVHQPQLDGKELAERFIKPAGGRAIAGVIFNEKGDAIAITADGKIVEPCSLPSTEGDASKSTGVEGAQLAECHGTTNTAIYKISQITAVRHKGSNCMTFSVVADGYVSTRTFCW